MVLLVIFALWVYVFMSIFTVWWARVKSLNWVVGIADVAGESARELATAFPDIFDQLQRWIGGGLLHGR